MVRSVSSANPESLERYAAMGEHLDQELDSHCNPLTARLEHFEATCTEPEFRTSASGLGATLRGYARDLFPFDDWVRQIARRFAWADGLRLGGSGRSAPGQTVEQSPPDSRRSWFNWNLRPPAWLAGIIEKLPWVSSDRPNLEGETELGKLMSDLEGKTELGKLIREDIPERSIPEKKESIQPKSFVTPRSIFSNGHRVTASFGTYGNGKLHNGVDIVPKDYKGDDGVDYSVYPVGPGIVHKVGTQKDDNGNLEGYGHYVVVCHTLSSGVTIYSRYAHLKEESALEEGAVITTEEALGFMGSTGTSTGDHVHLEVYNDRAENKWYFKHKPEEIFNEDGGITWDQKMRDGYYDPEEVINGNLGWQFEISDTLEDVN